MKQQLHRSFRVGLFGHYHGLNLGDEVVVASLIHNIRRHCPGTEIFGVSLNPADTSQRHRIPAISMAWGTLYRAGRRVLPPAENGSPLASLTDALERSEVRALQRAGRKIRVLSHFQQAWNVLRGADMLVVAGSQPLFDGWQGPWGHPFNLLKWAVLARSTDTWFVPLSVGAGPLDAPLSRLFVGLALRLSYYRSFRDPHSVAFIESMGVVGHNPVFPDLGFSLSSEEIEHRRPVARAGDTSGAVGISTVAHSDPRYLPYGDADKYEAYLHKLVGFAAWLLDNGYTLRLLRSQVEADERVADDLRARLKAKGLEIDERVVASPTRTYRDLLDQMARCELVVGGRFHCHVLPFLLGKPVLGVAYHPKTFDLMAYMGQAEHCLDIDEMDAAAMIERFKRLREQRATAVETIERRVRDCREVLDVQYDRLFRRDCTGIDQNYLPAFEGHERARVTTAFSTSVSTS